MFISLSVTEQRCYEYICAGVFCALKNMEFDVVYVFVCVSVRPVSWVRGLSSDQVSRCVRNVNHSAPLTCSEHLCRVEYWKFVYLWKLYFAKI